MDIIAYRATAAVDTCNLKFLSYTIVRDRCPGLGRNKKNNACKKQKMV